MRRVAADLRDRRDVTVGGVEVDQKESEPVEGTGFAVGASKEEADLGFECLARPDLATVDDPATHAVFDRTGHDPARVSAGIGFGHTESHV